MTKPMLTATEAELRPSRWPLWVAGICLTLAGWPLLMQGIADWQDDDVLRESALKFIQHVTDGRPQQALACLTDEYRSAILSQGKFDSAEAWPPSDESSTRILSVQQAGDSAEVRVSVAKSGFSIKPLLIFRRTSDRSWKIARIEGVEVDPRWNRWKDEERHEPDEQLARELAEKLLDSHRQ